MFWFLHYSVKVLIGLALVGTGGFLYANRHWLAPAEEWAVTLRRADLERLEILGTNAAVVVRVPTGDTVVVRDGSRGKLVFRIAGVVAPPKVGQIHSPAWQAFEQSRQFLSGVVLSNPVETVFTFLVPRAGGVGGVYLGGTNVALRLLDAGMVIVHDGSLKGLPLTDQVALLAAEKKAREEKRGFWSDPVNVADLRTPPETKP